ncbi:MAG: hypothetical protein AUK48_15565 [Oscillatoriales cyanobacterium CG2_30_44_21]|nr:MAG: hypothetical protein AUK48_15565 [Oscillatoriales cyanobacterium CG2_30_44_21]
MKLANPLYYPLAVAVSGFVLVLSVRLANIPVLLALPISAAIATSGAVFLKRIEPEDLGIGDPELEGEIITLKQQAQTLTQQAQMLRVEAGKVLVEAEQMDLLVSVQYACDRACELPSKIDLLVRKMKGGNTLLSIQDLEQQLQQVKRKLGNSSGIAASQMQTLADGLQRNIELVRGGESAKQAQVANLATLIVEVSGILQELQNKLRVVNLQDLQQTAELRSLTDELSYFQENADLLLTK